MRILETTEDYSIDRKDDFYSDVIITYGSGDNNNDDDDDDDDTSSSSESGFDDVQNIREYIISNINDYSR